MREIILLLFFALSFLFMTGILYFILMRDKKLEKRMNYYFDINKKYKKLKGKKAAAKGKSGDNFLKGINEFIREKLSSRNQEKIEQLLKSAGVKCSPEEYIMLKWFLTAAAGGILYFLSDNLVLLVLGGVFGYAVPKIWIDRRRSGRIQKFNDGLPDMINTVIGSLRSGYSFSQALKTVAEECESPIKDEIEYLLREMSCGIPMEEALNNLGMRMPSGDLELMIQTVLIQKQVGGNLAGVLEIIVKTIRERNKVQRQVKTLTSQGRLSGKIIGALPVVIGLAIYLINPEYITPLFANTLGIIMITSGIISGLIGFIMIHKLTKIEV